MHKAGFKVSNASLYSCPSRWNGSALTLRVTPTADTHHSSSVPRNKAFPNMSLRYSGYTYPGKLGSFWFLKCNHLYGCIAMVVPAKLSPPQLSASLAVPGHKTGAIPHQQDGCKQLVWWSLTLWVQTDPYWQATGPESSVEIYWCRRWRCSSRRKD